MAATAPLVTFLNARPLAADGPAERTLGWLAGRLAAAGATTRLLLTEQHAAIAAALETPTVVCAGDLRPGSDLPVVGALAEAGLPVVLLDPAYGFCAIGTRTCGTCALAATCRDSDRVALYRALARVAALVVHLSPQHRAASEAFLGAWPAGDERAVVAPPPALPPLPPAAPPAARDFVAFWNPNDPGEWSNLVAHAWRLAADATDPDDGTAPPPRLVVYGAPPLTGPTPPPLVRAPALERADERHRAIARAAGFVCLPSRPLPFGADALAALHAGRAVHTNAQVGFRSHEADLTDPAAYGRTAAAWEALARRVVALAPAPAGVPAPRPAPRPAPCRRPLLWSHRMGLGDVVNLLPAARALARVAARAGGALTWVVPDRHLPLVAGQCDATLVPADAFRLDAVRRDHDLVLEVSVAMRTPGERFDEADVLGERHIRLDLARLANAYESVHANLLSFLARGGIEALGGRPSLDPARLPLAAARARLEAAGVAVDDDLLVTLHPGAGRDFKRWPAAAFGALARQLTDDLGARVAVVAGPDDAGLAAAIQAAAPAVALVSLGDPWPEAAALLAHATLHVGNDSGLSHVAAALGVPTVALFGPTAPARWAPASPLCRVVVARDAAGAASRDLAALPVATVAAAVRALLAEAAALPPARPDARVVRAPQAERTPAGWRAAAAEVGGDEAANRALDALMAAAAAPIAWGALERAHGAALGDAALAAGLLVPPWAARGAGPRRLRAARAPAAAPEEPPRAVPRVAYVVEGGYQHAFPVLALLPVLPGPVFTPGGRIAARLAAEPGAEVHVVAEQELGAALAAAAVDVVVTTSHRLRPSALRGERGRPVVFVGHGESDKTFGQRSGGQQSGGQRSDDAAGRPQPSFVHHATNDEFDLIAVASHHHMARYRNPNRELTGYLKHDLFVRGGYAERRPEPDRVLWAPGWGRHSAVETWLEAVVAATGALGLRCVLHLHPHSYEVEPRTVQKAQAAVLRHPHVLLAHCANILDALAPSAVLLSDVTTVAYDWLLFDRPLVFLDHPGLVVEEEKRLFPVGIPLRPGADLAAALRAALADPTRQSAARREALGGHFHRLDGHAAERLRAAIERRWREEWRDRAPPR